MPTNTLRQRAKTKPYTCRLPTDTIAHLKQMAASHRLSEAHVIDALVWGLPLGRDGQQTFTGSSGHGATNVFLNAENTLQELIKKTSSALGSTTEALRPSLTKNEQATHARRQLGHPTSS